MHAQSTTFRRIIRFAALGVAGFVLNLVITVSLHERLGVPEEIAFAVALAVVATGVIFGSLGVQPLQAIMLAQAANGLLLPVVAVFLLWAANNAGLLGTYVNRPLTNIVGGAVVLVAAGLGGWALLKVIRTLLGLA